MHADLKARDSLALDLMEAVRPQVDAFVLDLLRSRTFAARDFFETREGGCRLMPPLAKLLAEIGSQWAAALGPVVERVARLLMGPAAAKSAMPTPLTQANRSAGRDGLRRGERQKRMPDAALPAACLMCGLVLEWTGRDYCDGCLPEYRTEQATESFGQAGPSALTRLRAEGIDPAHGGVAGRKRGERNGAHAAAMARWEREREGGEPTDLDTFVRDILPRLRGVSLRVIAEATGLSEGYCSFVRRGQKVPHRRHWPVLMQLGTERSS